MLITVVIEMFLEIVAGQKEFDDMEVTTEGCSKAIFHPNFKAMSLMWRRTTQYLDPVFFSSDIFSGKSGPCWKGTYNIKPEYITDYNTVLSSRPSPLSHHPLRLSLCAHWARIQTIFPPASWDCNWRLTLFVTCNLMAQCNWSEFLITSLHCLSILHHYGLAENVYIISEV